MGNESSSRRNSANAPPPTQQISNSNSSRPPPQSSPGAAVYHGNVNDPVPPGQQRYHVTVPQGVQPGQHFAVLVGGQQMMVRCPPGNRPNDRLIVTAPLRQNNPQFVVQVPPNVRPGDQFRVSINGKEVMVTCPPGVHPGQRVTFKLPENQDKPTDTVPNHQMFEVTVPNGVRPGEAFALIAAGQRVMVTCPPNVVAGQRVRFHLPMQLSQSQLEAIKVSYDKDGWMRCLAQDLKFHWVFNQTDDAKSTSFNVDEVAFVRRLVTNQSGVIMEIIPATDYSIETTVKGTDVSYQELSRQAKLPFIQKCLYIKQQFETIKNKWEDGHVKIRVRREHLLSDSLEAIESIATADMRRFFRFSFIGEPALDAGGLAREWYMLVSEQLFNPDCGLFSYSAVNQMCMQINHNSGIANEYHLKYFHFGGRVLGKALMDGHITPVHLVQPMYKMLMGWPVTLKDLEHIDDEVYNSMMSLLTIDDVSMLCLDFSVTEENMGLKEVVELIPDGGNVDVTNENLNKYLEEQVKYRLFNRVHAQLREFLRGFYDVVPEPFLSVFDFQEIELLLHGVPNIDMTDWMNHSEYTGEFQTLGAKHPVVKWFWEILSSLGQEDKAKLLQFTTGTSGVPAQGFAYLQGNDGNIRRFTLFGDKNVKVFPRSHTCFNRLDMPVYASKDDMQKYMLMAMSFETTGFDLE